MTKKESDITDICILIFVCFVISTTMWIVKAREVDVLKSANAANVENIKSMAEEIADKRHKID